MARFKKVLPLPTPADFNEDLADIIAEGDEDGEPVVIDALGTMAATEFKPTRDGASIPLLRKSQFGGVVAFIHEMADYGKANGWTRTQVVRHCCEQGAAFNTARTQYQWHFDGTYAKMQAKAQAKREARDAARAVKAEAKAAEKAKVAKARAKAQAEARA